MLSFQPSAWSYSARSASRFSEKVFCTTLEDYPSSTPKFITVQQLGPSTQYRLRWRQITNEEARGRILLYKLQWRTENGNFSNVQYLHGSSEEFTISGLQPSTPYFVRLLPATNAGHAPDENDSYSTATSARYASLGKSAFFRLGRSCEGSGSALANTMSTLVK